MLAGAVGKVKTKIFEQIAELEEAARIFHSSSVD